MKILFINKEDNRGGAALMAWNLAQELRKNGHQVRFLVRRKFSTDKNVSEIKENFVLSKLRKITKRDLTIVLSNLRDQILANDIETGLEKQILNHSWLKWADVVHCHNIHGNYFKLSNLIEISRRKPTVWTLHDLWAITGHCAYPFECVRYKRACGHCPRLSDYQKLLWDNSSYLINTKKKIYQQLSTHLVVPSLWMANKLGDSILKDQELSVIHNGIDCQVFKKTNNKTRLRRDLNLPENKKIVLFFTYGGKNINKGWVHIERIMKHFKDDSGIHFLGIGPTAHTVLTNVSYLDTVFDSTVMSRYYNSADMLLFPSLSESFGMVPLEASGCGLPVVAFPVGIIPQLIDHKRNGYVAKYGNTVDLIKGIEYVLSRKKEAIRTMARLSSKIVRTSFPLEQMGRSYSKIYEKIIH